MTDRAPWIDASQTDEARLRELAFKQARYEHRWGADRDTHRGLAEGFSTCPHPDCVLVRRSVDGTSQPETDWGAFERLEQFAVDVPMRESGNEGLTIAASVVLMQDVRRLVANLKSASYTHPPAVEGTDAGASALQTFNINDHVWIRLRAKGKAMLREQDARWSQLYATTYGRLPIAEKQETDYGGWSRWQFWVLIEAFGAGLYAGCDLPFETTLQFDTPVALPFVEPREAQQDGASLIAVERQRQMMTEGWTPDHDDEHEQNELIQAARAYIWAARQTAIPLASERLSFDAAVQEPCEWNGHVSEPGSFDWPVSAWPWDQTWWKPSSNPIRNLVKAGALIAAEIDRLQRAALPLVEPRAKKPSHRVNTDEKD